MLSFVVSRFLPRLAYLPFYSMGSWLYNSVREARSVLITSLWFCIRSPWNTRPPLASKPSFHGPAHAAKSFPSFSFFLASAYATGVFSILVLHSMVTAAERLPWPLNFCLEL